KWLEGLHQVQIVNGRAFYADNMGCAQVEIADGICEIRWEKLILTTGARERFLPFPDWTLPGIFGAGGLQALVKGGLPIKGKKVVVAGSGPLLMAVAAFLRGKGAEIAFIAEQTSWERLIWFGSGLIFEPAKLAQLIDLQWQLKG